MRPELGLSLAAATAVGWAAVSPHFRPALADSMRALISGASLCCDYCRLRVADGWASLTDTFEEPLLDHC
jgi:hypothetical protein